MMNYENFKKVVEEQFMDYMPKQYQGMKLRVEPCYKVNTNLDRIVLVEDGESVSPVLYINDLYKHYLDKGDLQEVLQSAAERLDEAFQAQPDVTGLSFYNAKDNIIFQVVNTLQNKEELLQDVPHREFQDLSIIYRRVIKTDKKGILSLVINNRFAQYLGMSEEDLFACAMENTRRILPPTVRSAKDTIRELIIRNGMPEEVADMMTCALSEDRMLSVISNEIGRFGAGSILYEDVLHGLAMKLKANLYILPSSMHECIAVSASGFDPYDLAKMVVAVNMEEVDLEERLSNQVYYYDRKARKLTLATDTPNKRLDAGVDDL